MARTMQTARKTCLTKRKSRSYVEKKADLKAPTCSLLLVNVKHWSGEFKAIERRFLADARKGGTSKFKILRISRIQNEELYEEFSVYRRRLESRIGPRNLNVLNLFHGTSFDNVNNIAKDGFDWRLCGKHGTAYGQGSYFAKDPCYSQGYCSQDEFGIKHMFLASVITGRHTQGDHRIVREPEGYHSTVDNLFNPQIYVVYHIKQSYPDYLISFTDGTEQIEKCWHCNVVNDGIASLIQCDFCYEYFHIKCLESANTSVLCEQKEDYDKYRKWACQTCTKKGQISFSEVLCKENNFQTDFQKSQIDDVGGVGPRILNISTSYSQFVPPCSHNMQKSNGSVQSVHRSPKPSSRVLTQLKRSKWRKEIDFLSEMGFHNQLLLFPLLEKYESQTQKSQDMLQRVVEELITLPHEAVSRGAVSRGESLQHANVKQNIIAVSTQQAAKLTRRGQKEKLKTGFLSTPGGEARSKYPDKEMGSKQAVKMGISKSFGKGEKVEVLWSMDNEWHSCVIEEVDHEDKTYSVSYSDGTIEIGVEPTQLRFERRNSGKPENLLFSEFKRNSKTSNCLDCNVHSKSAINQTGSLKSGGVGSKLKRQCADYDSEARSDEIVSENGSCHRLQHKKRRSNCSRRARTKF